MVRIAIFLGIFEVSVWAGVSPFYVVIDPGHGGSDEGTRVKDGPFTFREKDATLMLAKIIRRELERAGIKVDLTREHDEEVPLHIRTRLANQKKADLFLSVHTNSHSGERPVAPSGIETYILDHRSAQAPHRLWNFERKGIGTTNLNFESAAPSTLDIALILKDHKLSAVAKPSVRFACLVQSHLVRHTSVLIPHANSHSRGVKRSLFHVLLGAEMPSALLEVGFLSNAKDRVLIYSPRGQNAVASGIREAVDEFRSSKKTIAPSDCLVR